MRSQIVAEMQANLAGVPVVAGMQAGAPGLGVTLSAEVDP